MPLSADPRVGAAALENASPMIWGLSGPPRKPPGNSGSRARSRGESVERPAWGAGNGYLWKKGSKFQRDAPTWEERRGRTRPLRHGLEDGDGPRSDEWDSPDSRDAARANSREPPRSELRDAPRSEYRDAPRSDSRDGPRSEYRDGPRSAPSHLHDRRDDRDEWSRSGPHDRSDARDGDRRTPVWRGDIEEWRSADRSAETVPGVRYRLDPSSLGPSPAWDKSVECLYTPEQDRARARRLDETPNPYQRPGPDDHQHIREHILRSRSPERLESPSVMRTERSERTEAPPWTSPSEGLELLDDMETMYVNVLKAREEIAAEWKRIEAARTELDDERRALDDRMRRSQVTAAELRVEKVKAAVRKASPERMKEAVEGRLKGLLEHLSASNPEEADRLKRCCDTALAEHAERAKV